ncbi:MAG: Ig-like domain-containing protein, partial [Candidatus Accumulibacter sp.]|uniref:Ig-like domain-containing protein n=1 Tax=Accumulibacter sp. TaxID=2053492 RepID=UPI0028785AB8
GDLNSDGQVDGADSALWEAARAAQDPRADLTGDGLINPADRQVLTANTGFVANRAPQTQTPLPTLKTHTDLGLTRALAGLAEDLEGDPIYWRILGATHGSAKLNADGQTLAFTPEPGYTGEATITVQADDGFAAGAPIELTVQISGARLIRLNLQRLAGLRTGATAQMKAIGDFEDEANDSLAGNAVRYRSSNQSVLEVSEQGLMRGLKDGTAIVRAFAQGIESVNVVSVGLKPQTPSHDAAGNELALFPGSIILPLASGQRQIDLHSLTFTETLGTDYTGSDSLEYFISQPGVVTVSAQGLIRAIGLGRSQITVVRDGYQASLAVEVVEPVIGSSAIDASIGGVVQDSVGNTLMIAPQALKKDAVVSIRALALDELDIPLPAAGIWSTLAVVDLDIGQQTAAQPLQLALRPPAGNWSAGTELLFWRWGEINLPDGSVQKTWWLVDDGVIGDDGLARTASPPYKGLLVDGRYAVTLVTKQNEATGDFSVRGATLNVDAIYLAAASVAFFATAGASSGQAGAAIALEIASTVVASAYTFDLFAFSYAGTYHKRVPAAQLQSELWSGFPVRESPAPQIQQMTLDTRDNTLTVRGVNFLSPDQRASSFNWQIWLEPRGWQLTELTRGVPDRGLLWQGFDAVMAADGSLKALLPAGVALSQHNVYLQRSVRTPDPLGLVGSGEWMRSDARQGWQDGTDKSLIATADRIRLYRSTTSPQAPAEVTLVADLTRDERGEWLQLQPGTSQGVAYTADGTLAFVAGKDSRIYVVDLGVNAVVHTLSIGQTDGRINALVTANDWLYVAQQSGAKGAGGLTRVYINQLSATFLKTRQRLQIPGYEQLTSFKALAVNSSSYLGVSADLAGPIDLVAFIDLQQLDGNGRLPADACIAVTQSDYPRANLGKNPVYLASGKNPGEFAVCNRDDLDRGFAGIVLEFDESGRINSRTKLKLASTALSAPVPNLYQGYDASNQEALWSLRKTYHEDIQAASGAVLMEYKGEQYALVADFNLWFNDPLTTGYSADMPRTQIGGKVGIIQNPFGRNNRAPVYLGATTPIVGAAVRKLALTEDGTLLADVWNYQPNLDLEAPMSHSLYAWNAYELVQGALNIHQSNRDPKHYYPIDRVLPDYPTSLTMPQIQELTPARYDEDGNRQNFNSFLTLGSYQAPGSFRVFAPTTAHRPYLEAIPSGAQVSDDGEESISERAWGLVLEGFNLALGGFLERGAKRWDDYQSGKMSFGEMALRNLGDYGVFVVSTVASGGAVTAGKTVATVALHRAGFEKSLEISLKSRLGKSVAYALEGSAVEALFNALEQGGQNALRVAWDEETKAFEWDTLGLNAAFGGLGGLAGAGLGDLAARLGTKIRDSDIVQAVQDAFRYAGNLLDGAARRAQRQVDRIPGTHELPLELKTPISIRLVVGDVIKEFLLSTPRRSSMSVHEATSWAIDQIDRIKPWLEQSAFQHISVEEKLRFAWQMKQYVVEGAANALYYIEIERSGVVRTFKSSFRTDTLESLIAESRKLGLSGQALFADVMEKIVRISCFIAGTPIWT